MVMVGYEMMIILSLSHFALTFFLVKLLWSCTLNYIKTATLQVLPLLLRITTISTSGDHDDAPIAVGVWFSHFC